MMMDMDPVSHSREDRAAAAEVLTEAVLLDGSPQERALGEAVASHIANRPRRVPASDADVDRFMEELAKIRKETP